MRLRTLALCMLLSGVVGVGHADERTNLETPQMGSYLKRATFEGQMPINKTYAELSDDEKAELRSAYENMPETDEPPYPEYGLQQIWTPLIKLGDVMNKNGVLLRGRFYAMVRVDGNGKGRSIAIAETPDPDFNKPAAIILMKKVTYKPARCAGAPCVMDFPVNLEFIIKP